MEPIRIVLAQLPRMLRDILHLSLLNEPDVVLVGEGQSLEELERIVRQSAVDVVVMGVADADLPVSHYRLFDIDARVRILAIADHGRSASLHELRPYQVVLGEGSPIELIQAIREQVRRGNVRGSTAGNG